MPRRTRKEPDVIQQILLRTGEYINTPLSNVAKKLQEDLLYVKQAQQNGLISDNVVLAWCKKINLIFDRLPRILSPRFNFDSVMLQAIQEEWTQSSDLPSNILIPKYEKIWGHERHGLLSEDREKTHTINLIWIRGADDLDDIDLLSYPWMCHEVGHNLLFRDDSEFQDDFRERLAKIVRALRIASIADRGSAKVKAEKNVDWIESLWTPTMNHSNWAHELAIDIIALYTCGPAYLASFIDELDFEEGEQEAWNPYEIVQSHPPFEVRTLALIEVAKGLGWQRYTKQLNDLLRKWKRSRGKYHKTNNYITVTNINLVEACTTSALNFCKFFSIPQCTPEKIQTIKKIIDEGQLPDFGTELIIAAWWIREQKDPLNYEQWERETIKKLLDDYIIL